MSDITTARLRLSRWDPVRHTPALEAINASPDAVRYLNGGVPYTPEESAGQSARFAAHWERYGFGLWAVTLIDTGELIGFLGLQHPVWFPAFSEHVEVGWRLHPSAWGNGYATEGARAALTTAWSELGLDRVISLIDPANTPSIAVAERLGMTRDERVSHPQRPGLLDIYAVRAPANPSR